MRDERFNSHWRIHRRKDPIPLRPAQPDWPSHYGRPTKAKSRARPGRASPTAMQAQGCARRRPRARLPPPCRGPTPVRCGPRDPSWKGTDLDSEIDSMSTLSNKISLNALNSAMRETKIGRQIQKQLKVNAELLKQRVAQDSRKQ